MKSARSVIQSTTVKISIVMITVWIVLFFVIARFYFCRELALKENELLSAAYLAGKQVEASYTQNEGVVKLSEQFLQKYSEMDISYYDHGRNTKITLAGNNVTDLLSYRDPEEIYSRLLVNNTPEFIVEQEILQAIKSGALAVALPVYDQGAMAGYIWASMQFKHVFNNIWLQYCQILIPMLLLWLLVLLIIKKTIAKIHKSLDAFSQMVVNNQLDEIREMKQLPELEPVFERIKVHLHKLQDLNNQLEYSNEKLRMIMEGISDALFSLDPDWKFAFTNEETARLLMTEDIDLDGKNIFDTVPLEPVTMDNLKKAMLEKKLIAWESQTSNGRYLEYRAYPFKQGLTVFVRDRTEEKKKDHEIQRLERLNLIGQMAAGISHEIRNPLATVRGFLQLMQGRPDTVKNREYLELMISEIDRANDIISDFLSLSKVSSYGMKMANLNEIILKIYPMLQADALNSDKDIILDLNDLPKIGLNESEIRQLILNLVRNGIEETPAGGFVTIRTYCDESSVYLSIIDKGKGIPQHIQDNIGTPFITTKENGTGLGLAISIGIANRHNAKFDFITGEKGTTIFIRFPRNKYLKNS